MRGMRQHGGQTGEFVDAGCASLTNSLPRADARVLPYKRGRVGSSSKPMKVTASSTDLRRETTALAGKVSSGQPMAMQIMMTWSSGIRACSRTTGDCMMPWLLMTQPRPRDQAAFTRALVTAPQSKGAMSLPWI